MDIKNEEVKWYANLLEKKPLVAYSLMMTILFSGMLYYYSKRQKKWDMEKADMETDLKVCYESKDKETRFVKEFLLEEIRDLKVKKDTAYAILFRVQAQLDKKK